MRTKQKQCKNGHKLIKANVYQRANGTRECKLCCRARALKRRADLREAKVTA